MFERFDERTRQQAVAPPDKLTTLHSLTVADVRSVFIPFSTVNGELLDSLLGREAGANVPCAFKSNAPPATSEGSDESTVTLNRAMAALHSGDLKQAGQLAVLALRQIQPIHKLPTWHVSLIGNNHCRRRLTVIQRDEPRIGPAGVKPLNQQPPFQLPVEVRQNRLV